MPQQRRTGRTLEASRAGPRLRRDDRHRHEPAGPAAEEAAALDGLAIDTLHSHLACADEDHALNTMQLERFRAIAEAIPARRYSLANSPASAWGATTASTSSGPACRCTAASHGARPKEIFVRSPASRPRSSSAAPSVPAKPAVMARPSLPRPTPRRRSSTSVTRTAICAAFRGAAWPLPGSLRCQCLVACRWI